MISFKQFLIEATEYQLQDEKIKAINDELTLILNKAKQNDDFKKFFADIAINIQDTFNGEDLEVFELEKPKVIIRSGLKDTGEENFKILTLQNKNEIENVILNVKWNKNDKGFLLKNLKVIKK